MTWTLYPDKRSRRKINCKEEHRDNMSLLLSVRSATWLRDDSLLEDLLEDVLEPAVIALHDGVLGGHVEGPLLLECHLPSK